MIKRRKSFGERAYYTLLTSSLICLNVLIIAATIAGLFWLASLMIGTSHAADMGKGSETNACIPNTIKSEQMMAWDFMAIPDNILFADGFRLAHMVRTILINDMDAVPVLMDIAFKDENMSAVATGFGRASCVCIRGHNVDYVEKLEAAVRTKGKKFTEEYTDAVSQCLVPVQHFGGVNGVMYGNVSPTKIGVKQ